MKPNPPIKGHALLHEGHSVKCYSDPSGVMWYWEFGCECGATPFGGHRVGVNEMKRWHREHKASLRRGTQIRRDITSLADHFSPWSFTEHDVTS